MYSTGFQAWPLCVVWKSGADLALTIVFTWRHGSHVDVPKQRNGAMLVSPTNPLGIELYSYANTFLCFGWKNVLIDNESENTPYFFMVVNAG